MKGEGGSLQEAGHCSVTVAADPPTVPLSDPGAAGGPLRCCGQLAVGTHLRGLSFKHTMVLSLVNRKAGRPLVLLFCTGFVIK